MINFIGKTKLWFSISIIITIIGLGSFLARGFNLGIDFTGGTIAEIEMGKTYTETEKTGIITIISKYDDKAAVNSANSNTLIDIKSNSSKLNEENIQNILKELKVNFPDLKLKSQESIGSVIGGELQQKALIAVSLSILAILIFVGIRFEFKFGIAAVVALIHDVIITLSFYSILRIQVDSPFIAAILTVLGYSISDTIVVFDRIRENLKIMRRAGIEEIANVSINQVVKRSIYTVTTTLITISSVTILVPQVRNFGIPLIIGILSGCYSSIFIASPLWVMLKNKSKTKLKV